MSSPMPAVDLHLVAAQFRAIVDALPPTTPAERRLAGRLLEAAALVDLCADGLG